MEIDEVSSAAKAAGLIEVRMTTRVGGDELHAVTYISPTLLTNQSAFETVLDDLLFQSKTRIAEAMARRAIAEACDNRESK